MIIQATIFSHYERDELNKSLKPLFLLFQVESTKQYLSYALGGGTRQKPHGWRNRAKSSNCFPQTGQGSSDLLCCML